MGRGITEEEFKSRVRKLHGNDFEIKEGTFKSVKSAVIIICPIHGEQEIPKSEKLIYREKSGCQKCSLIRKGKEKNEKARIKFYSLINKIYGDTYNYNITEYVDSETKLKYICKEHGIIEQLPNNHIKYGCPYCGYKTGGEKIRKSLEEFVLDSKSIHNNKYDY